MTTTTTSTNLSKYQVQAFKRRQLDTSWGYAFAWLIPLVGLYYSIKRRTLTPFLYVALGNFATGVLVAACLTAANPKVGEGQIERTSLLFGLLTTPLLAKRGIVQARNHAKLKLLENDIEL